MKKILIAFVMLCCLFLRPQQQALRSSPPLKPEPHRSPIDVAVLPGGQLALCANHTADSVSLVDLIQGNVVDEIPCGHKPVAVACSRDGKRAAVSNLWSGTLTLIELQATKLKKLGDVAAGSMPRGVAFDATGASLYVALAGTSELVQFDWNSQRILRRWPAPVEPRQVVLSHDGRSVAAVSARSAQVRCWDTQTHKLRWEQMIDDAFNVFGLAFSPDDKDLVTAMIHHHQHSMTKRNIEEGWALNSRLTKLKNNPEASNDYWQIALDVRHKAVGDPCAVAFSARGDWLVTAAAGTQELLVFKSNALPWSSGGPGDFLDSSLDTGAEKYRRIPLGGRPLSVHFIEARPQVVVANYLSDALQVVDIQAGEIVRTIALGGPREASLARKGEAIFYDARRSHHQWFSCHTCHADGHTSGRAFDTLNDDSYGNPKLTPSLRGVTKTGPWTWHGWQKSIDAAVEKSLTDTLFGPKPTPEDVKAVVAFLATLDFPASPFLKPDGSRSEAAERGKQIFQGKGGCVRCHQGEFFTSSHTYDVKLELDGSPYDRWNPPSLRGIFDRGPYMHEGKVESLDELLRRPHAPDKLGGEPLTPTERTDLIEFLKTL